MLYKVKERDAEFAHLQETIVSIIGLVYVTV